MKRLWAAWQRAARRSVDLQARWLLAALYYTLFVPFAIAARLTKTSRHGWQPRTDAKGAALTRAGRQS
ncbi:MAG: hypothetical protein ACE15B_17135 [Bryobacteraceae bacterium]